MPSGGIIIWSGAANAIPSGWYLCNGSNGTPDLRNRFVIGAGSTYSVAATGGSKDAIVVSHTHTATSTSSVTDPGHTHTLLSKNEATGGGGQVPKYSGVGSITNNEAIQSITTGITVSTSTTNASAGSSGTDANLPPYYALCYIMKS